MITNFSIAVGMLLIVTTYSAIAQEFILPPDDVDIVGEISTTEAVHEDTIIDIARRYNVGFTEIVSANPNADRWLLKEGTKITLPTRYILPRVPREGIVVNSPEMRLYYFPPAIAGQAKKLITHPVSVGRTDWGTPLGITKILAKIVDPVWNPPESIRKAEALEGNILPKVVPAGPDNPLGKYAMRLAVGGGSYLIHGTDKRKEMGIGLQVTHGCMRMYSEDIENLFKQVPVNMKVNLIDQPVKLGWWSDILFIEVTTPLEQDLGLKEDEELPQEELEEIIQNKLRPLVLEKVKSESERRMFTVNPSALKRAIEEHNGIPVAISRLD
jgi:L,D-transpeptidase ErfK/SrfK